MDGPPPCVGGAAQPENKQTQLRQIYVALTFSTIRTCPSNLLTFDLRE